MKYVKIHLRSSGSSCCCRSDDCLLKLYREKVTAEDCSFQRTLEIVSVSSWDKDCGGLRGLIKLSNDKYCTDFGSRSLLRTVIAV